MFNDQMIFFKDMIVFENGEEKVYKMETLFIT